MVEGARVSILARSLKKLEEAKESICLVNGIDVAVLAAGVRDNEALWKAMEEAGSINMLLVNQGVFMPQEMEKQDLHEVKFMVDVNLMGSFNIIKVALLKMKNKGNRGPTSIALISFDRFGFSSNIEIGLIFYLGLSFLFKSKCGNSRMKIARSSLEHFLIKWVVMHKF
ncbi:hypothetical protein UlMin_024190 [Ulmus minor]